MKEIVKSNYKSFIIRGILSMGGGPIVLAIVYLILDLSESVENFSGKEISLGVITVCVLAFVAGGITVVYQVDELPLIYAIIIHGSTLYFTYLLVYLLNGWLKRELVPFLIFTAAFLGGYAIIWIIIYLTTEHATKKINAKIHSD